MKHIYIKLFDMNNPNCKFEEKPSNEMFYQKPVLYNNNPIGVIPKEGTLEWRGDSLYGSAVIWDMADVNTLHLEFENYGVQAIKSEGDNTWKILDVSDIVLRKKTNEEMVELDRLIDKLAKLDSSHPHF